MSFAENDMALLKAHSRTKKVSLWVEGQPLENLDFVLNCDCLENIVIYGGKIGDYSALGKLQNLKKLFLNGRLRRWVESLDFINDLHALEDLTICNYPTLTYFPDLKNCVHLKRVEVLGCKRMTDISNVVLIPNLQKFGIGGTPQSVEDVEFIAQKQGMKQMSGTFGSKRKDEAFRQMLTKYNLTFG